MAPLPDLFARGRRKEIFEQHFRELSSGRKQERRGGPAGFTNRSLFIDNYQTFLAILEDLPPVTFLQAARSSRATSRSRAEAASKA